SGEAFLKDFDVVAGRMGSADEPHSVLGEAAAIARRSAQAAAIEGLSEIFARYLALHRRIAALETGGRFKEAVDLAVGSSARGLSLADALDSGLARQISAA